MNEKKSGWPLEDDDLEQVSGGMRPIAAGKDNMDICPHCGKKDGVGVEMEARWVCRNCGCVYGPAKQIFGFEQTIAGNK